MWVGVCLGFYIFFPLFSLSLSLASLVCGISTTIGITKKLSLEKERKKERKKRDEEECTNKREREEVWRERGELFFTNKKMCV